jgi:hypothetical protein
MRHDPIVDAHRGRILCGDGLDPSSRVQTAREIARTQGREKQTGMLRGACSAVA